MSHGEMEMSRDQVQHSVSDGQHDVFVRNTFLCVREESEESDEEPVRHIRSEPSGLRQRAVRRFPADWFEDELFGGESTAGSEDMEPRDSLAREDGARPPLSGDDESNLDASDQEVSEREPWEQEAPEGEEEEEEDEEISRADEPAHVQLDVVTRSTKVRQLKPFSCSQEAQDAASSVSVVTVPPCIRAVPVAAWSPVVGLAQPLQPTLWPMGPVAMAASTTQAPDTQASSSAHSSQTSAAPLAARQEADPARTAQPQQSLSGNDRAHVYWTVNARKIHSKETKVASPRFCIFLPTGPCPFQLMLYAEARSPRWGSSGFARARGRGRIELRCGTELPSGAGKITFSLNLGEQPARPPVSHDFSQQGCCGLRRWDFSSAVDPATGTFVVHLEIVSLGPFEGPVLGGPATVLPGPGNSARGGA